MKKVIGLLVVSIALFSAVGLAEQVTITYAHWNALQDPYNYVQAFEKANPNIKVNFTLIPESEYSQKLHTMAVTGTLPDVLCLWECDLGNFAKQSLIVPLDNYVAGSSVVSKSDFIPAVGSLMKMQGHLYGLPWCYATEVLYYNKDMFDKAGIPYPNDNWTWQDFEHAVKALTVTENGKVVQWGCDALSFQGLWYSLIGTFGDKIVNDKGQIDIGDGARKFLQWWHDLTNKYIAPPQVAAVGVPTTDLFQAGKAAMTFQGSWMSTSVYKGITDFNWDMAPIPRGVRNYSTLHTGFYAINAKSTHKDAAWKFIEFCLDKQGQELINRGCTLTSAEPSLQSPVGCSPGPKGPTNWSAITKTAQFAEWGYVLLPPGLTFNIVKDFYGVMLDQMTVDQALKHALQMSIETLGDAGVAPEMKTEILGNQG